jgi:hypothetical protein
VVVQPQLQRGPKNWPSSRLRRADDLVGYCVVPLIKTSIELILADGIQAEKLSTVSPNMQEGKAQRSTAPQCIQESSYDSAPGFRQVVRTIEPDEEVYEDTTGNSAPWFRPSPWM